MAWHGCPQDFLGNEFSHSVCWFYVLYNQFPKFWDSLFSTSGGTFVKFPHFLFKEFQISHYPSQWIWIFFYTQISSGPKEIPTQSDSKHPALFSTQEPKPIQVYVKCNLQPGTWHFHVDFQICPLSACPLQFSTVIFRKESENPDLESIHIIMNGKANFITLPVKMMLTIN